LLGRFNAVKGARLQEEIYRTLGTNIRDRRLAMELSLKELAKTLGVSYQELQKYEKGRNRLPTHMLATLAWKFGCTTDELCGLKEEPRSPELMRVLQKIDRIPSARLSCRLLKLVETAVEFGAVASDDSPTA